MLFIPKTADIILISLHTDIPYYIGIESDIFGCKIILMRYQMIFFIEELKMHNMDANKTAGEEARRQLHKNAASNLEQVLAATPHKTPTIRQPASHRENYPS